MTERILVHDYSGHPFQVQLSRSLARRGHQVLHLFSTRFQTPRGNLLHQAGDPDGFEVRGIALPEEFQKNSFIKRRAQEVQFGALIGREIHDFRPDIVISSNAPLDTQRKILSASRHVQSRFIFWLQDIYSEAISRILPRKLPLVGGLVANYYRALEYRLLRQSDHVVAITEDFVSVLAERGVSARAISVIENWAPIDELAQFGRDNHWATSNMPGGGLRVVYSGTLGYKHNPDILIAAAKSIDGTVYVFSEGAAAKQLARDAAHQGVSNLSVRPWVAFEDLPKMLSGADILLAVIEPEAGLFSVPSKILTYLCAGRPILAAMPEGNLASKIIAREQAGMVAAPNDVASFTRMLGQLVEDAELRARMGEGGRSYAESAFDIDAITDRFEQTFDSWNHSRVMQPGGLQHA